jgi:hypothetical protein
MACKFWTRGKYLLMQAAQKCQTSHPPTLARRDAPCPKQGRSERIKMILPSLLAISLGMGAD